MYKWKLGELYEVHWEDIVAFSGWMAAENPSNVPARCITHGYLTDYKKGKTGYVRISATYGVNDDGTQPEYTQHIVIPTGTIKSVITKENPGD